MRQGMYLVLPVPFRVVDGLLSIDRQSANALERWAENFAQLTVAAPVIPETLAPTLEGLEWRAIDSLSGAERISPQTLPWAYTPASFFKQVTGVRRLMGATIRQSEHLQFSIGGMVGDWAAVAAMEAIRLKRHYAIQTDRVEHERIRRSSRSASSARRLKVAVEAPLMERYHRHIITHCSLGLWQGEDCFRAYAPWCEHSFLLREPHTPQSAIVAEAPAEQSITDVSFGNTLRIVSLGDGEGPGQGEDMLTVLSAMRAQGLPIEATIFKPAAQLDQARARAQTLHLEKGIRLASAADRESLLLALREAHLVAFTQPLEEAALGLREALASRTAMLGYDSPSARRLLEEGGGVLLVPANEPAAFSEALVRLATDRRALADLTQAAARNGSCMTEAAVYLERSALVRKFA